MTFQEEILAGIPAAALPEAKPYDSQINHAPKRKDILKPEEKVLALRNALRYFPEALHAQLAPEFAQELKEYGRIYMYRYRPSYKMYARPINEYPAKSRQAAAIMAMIQNNLDERVAQHPHELIIYGGNGAIFQNWAQYRLVMQYLSTMTDEQTLVMYSGHPLGLFPSHKDAPRVIVTNGMVIPNYSKPDDWERFNALGDGHSQLLQTGRLGKVQRPGRFSIRPDDGRVLYVYRSSRHCTRHHHHGDERRPQAGWQPGRQAVCNGGPGRYERCAAQGRQHCRGGERDGRNQSQSGRKAP